MESTTIQNEPPNEMTLALAEINDKSSDGMTLLHSAAINGQADVVQSLLKSNYDVKAKNVHGSTPLHAAAFNGHLEIVKFLMAAGADVNAKTQGGLTPADAAKMKDHSEIINVLNGFVPDSENKLHKHSSSHSPKQTYFIDFICFVIHPATLIGLLFIYLILSIFIFNRNQANYSHELDQAVIENNLTKVNAIINNPDYKSDLEQNTVIYSTPEVINGRRTGFKKYHSYRPEGVDEKRCDRYEVALNNRNKEIVNALHSSSDYEFCLNQYIRHNNFKAINSFIAIGLNINTSLRDDSNLLHWASKNSQTETVKALIASGADIHAKNKNGQTPLHLAQNIETVKALIASGAKVDARDKDGMTPLHVASQKNAEVVKALIAAEADLNAQDNLRNTPLYLAAQQGHLESLKALIVAGADFQAKNDNEVTPLHEAAKEGHLEVVKALITAKANVNAKDDDGDTPLHLTQDIDIVKALIAAGADIHAKNNEGQTPISLARMN